MAKITLAFGKEIQLAADKKTGKSTFIKLSTTFKDEQLRELKGAPLAVLICRALHSDEKGYTFVSNATISKETGYSEITPANRFLVDRGYLFMEQLVDRGGRFRGWISRLFLPIEPNFRTTMKKNGKRINVFVKTEVGKNPSSVKVPSREKTDLTRTSIKQEPINKQEKYILSSKDNTQSVAKAVVKKEKPSSAKTTYGNPDINNLLSYLKERMGLPILNGTAKDNRFYAHNALRKFGGLEKCKLIVDAAADDEWWRYRLTSARDLFYNGIRIISASRDQKKRAWTLKRNEKGEVVGVE